MRRLILSMTLLFFTNTSVAFSNTPQAGDVLYFDGGVCALLHFDPATGVSHVISKWDCLGATGATVGAGPTDWRPGDSGELAAGPDGWIYIKGFSETCCSGTLVYRIDPENGNREYVGAFTEALSGNTGGFYLWPSPSHFTPSVAALSAGAAALLVGLLVGSVRRDRKRRRLD